MFRNRAQGICADPPKGSGLPNDSAPSGSAPLAGCCIRLRAAAVTVAPLSARVVIHQNDFISRRALLGGALGAAAVPLLDAQTPNAAPRLLNTTRREAIDGRHWEYVEETGITVSSSPTTAPPSAGSPRSAIPPRGVRAPRLGPTFAATTALKRPLPPAATTSAI